MTHRAGASGWLPVLFLAACSDTAGPGSTPSIVFDWLRDGNREIYRVALDGSAPVRLTRDPGDDQEPTSGGGTVVFTSYRDGNAELYAMPAHGGGARRLTFTAANETEPTLSRDGSRLAYVSDGDGIPRVWVASADGTGATRLTVSVSGTAVEVGPNWSPAGDRLVFVSTTNGSADLFIATPGSAPTVLVAGPGAEVEPAWSPDGGGIAFVSDRDGDPEIYVVTLDGGQLRRVTNRAGVDAQPSWLADGKIVFTSWSAESRGLRWLDPGNADRVNDVDLGPNAAAAEHAAAVF